MNLFISNILLISFLIQNSIENIEKRYLLFPQFSSNLFQFVFGFGTPVDSIDESLTFGWIVKVKYELPTKASDFSPEYLNPRPINTARRMPENDSNGYSKEYLPKYRWIAYKCIEALFERMGYPGKYCMLRSICEAAATKFHYQTGIISEILQIVMSPSSTADELNYYQGNIYLYAEKMGKSGAPCNRVFKDCKDSVLEKFSEII